MKDKIYLGIIILLLVVFSIWIFSLKSDNEDLLQEYTDKSELIKKDYEEEKDSLIIEYKDKINNFKKADSSLKEINKNLNFKIRNYEKKLNYADRTFDDAADILSRARYTNKQKE